MSEEIKKAEELKKAAEAAAQDAQKLDDEALDAVAGGRWPTTTIINTPPKSTPPKGMQI